MGLADGNNIEEWSDPEGRDNESRVEWLRKSLVGTLHDSALIDTLQDAFILHGFLSIKVRHMGDKMMLLSGSGDENVVEILKGDERWIEEIF